VDYDLAAGERESLVAKLTAQLPEIDFDIAGETGIDIYPMGKTRDKYCNILIFIL